MSDPSPYDQAFFAAQEEGSRRSARCVLTAAFRLLDAPRSIVDVGCGVGTWLSVAAELGATDLLGLDGDWVPREQLQVPASTFQACDLGRGRELTGSLPRSRFDLVMSLEVAEHLPPDRAVAFVNLLSSLGDVVLFSAAIPHQGGVGHLNENWPGYWSDLFRQHDFACFDVLRPIVWLHPEIEWWYAQNVLLFAKRGTPGCERLRGVANPVNVPLPLVHPRKYLLVQEQNLHLHLGLQEALTRTELPPLPARMADVRHLEAKIDTLRALLATARVPGFDPDTVNLDLTSRIDSFRGEIDRRNMEINRLQSENSELRASVSGLAETRALSEAQAVSLTQVREQVATAREEAVRWRALCEAQQSSTSWRLTAPLRRIGRRLRG